MHVAITGASSGIGLALAKVFGQYANSISLIARRRAILEKEAKYLGIPYFCAEADLADIQHCCDWINKAEDQNGPIDVLINNAGMQLVGRALTHDALQIDKMFQLNLLTPIKITEAILPGMLKRQRGCIIQIASMAAVNHMPGMAHYCSTKAGLSSYNESLRLDYKDQGVQFLTVYPGPIETEMASSARKKYRNSAVDLLPAASAEELATEVYECFKHKKERLFFPKVYALQGVLPSFSQWVINQFAPMPE